jgi:RimJ/RimL family protein N-acetyltransferase
MEPVNRLSKVLEGKDVDVLSPFPLRLLPQAVQWLHCHPTLTMADNSPRSPEDLQALLEQALTGHPSYAIVDKHNLSRVKSTDMPVVGIVTVEHLPPWSAYVHIASNRKAWGDRLAQPGLLEQGGRLILKELFSEYPELLRVSAAPLSHNAAARGLCKRLGFVQDGLFEDAVRVGGKIKSIVHYGITRSAWEEPHE